MSLSYFGSRISDHMLTTPEGYLVCVGAAIARSGTQNYLPDETPDPGRFTQPVPVLRPPQEVFDQASIASYEGKPIVDEHPSVDIDVGNHSLYSRGFIKNVRRGENEFADCLLADLVVTDPGLISKIKNGKREISAGYEAQWLPTADGYEQTRIRCNHIAVVSAGRAGRKVSIRDKKPEKLKGATSKMDIKEKIKARILSVFSKDAEPEELAEAAKLLMTEEEPGEKEEVTLADLTAKVNCLAEQVEAIIAAEKRESAHEGDEINALDALEQELEKAGADPDEKETVVFFEEEELEADEETELTEKAARDAAIARIKIVKPILSAIQDPGERKRACDAAVLSIRKTVKDSGYSDLARLQKAAKNQKAADSQKPRPEYDTERGKRIADARHPLAKKGDQ